MTEITASEGVSEETAKPAQPKQDRLVSIDVLRGFAVLGILMMNIQAFAMFPWVYENPTLQMDLTGDNLTVWAIANTFFNTKFITLFSALFGAGMVLMAGESGSTGKHYPRMWWLLLIGMIHAYVFWYGDILVAYAVMGMFVVKSRGWSIRTLVIVGLLLIGLSGLLTIGGTWAQHFFAGAKGSGAPDEVAQGMLAAYQDGFVDHIPWNAGFALVSQIAMLIFFSGRLAGVMMIGMALFKSGFLSAKWSWNAYLITGAISLALGLGLSHVGTEMLIETEFAGDTFWQAMGANYVGSLFAALGYAAVVMMICKSGVFGWITAVFAATGRMAFTNYLTQTLIMTFIFVGAPGLGLFGTMERIDQAQLVLMVWAAQLIWSPLWLSVFRFGPLEWLWRSLTYGRLQPITRSKS